MRGRAEETRERILAAAEECFARQGYDATGVAEICERAGVSKGAFFHHFPTKQAVFLALLERWLKGLEEQLTTLRAGAATVPAAMMQMAGTAQQVFEMARERLFIFLEFLNRAARDPQVWKATIQPYHRYREFFARMIEAGVAEGSLRPVDPEAAASAILSMAIGLVLQATMDPEGADWGDLVRKGLRILLDGLQGSEATG
ncbi:MAG: TetR/AcrR family transcriptional regulator [Thermoflexales bacterium]|nr:TetR/AcrR family transcriptional regulator [Thermoflexales bacterium]